MRFLLEGLGLVLAVAVVAGAAFLLRRRDYRRIRFGVFLERDRFDDDRGD